MFARRPSRLEELLRRPRPSGWQRFRRTPFKFLATWLYTYHRMRRIVPPALPTDAVSVVCISDTHTSQPELPDGDVLIHAGDLTQSGSAQELQTAAAWLQSQPHKHKIVIAGNHDQLLDPSKDTDDGHAAEARASLNWDGITYLQDSSARIKCANGRCLRIYGNPRSPQHGNWAFQYPRNRNIWNHAVAEGTDVLVTHAPPAGHLDAQLLGCRHLLKEVWRVRPRLHVCGHVHEGYGQEWIAFDEVQNAYEQIVAGKEGWLSFLDLVRMIVHEMLSPNIEGRCLLVNPSMVGGLRDDERRQPIKVCI
jgi:calcineurin-like phosphoesterase family protein